MIIIKFFLFILTIPFSMIPAAFIGAIAMSILTALKIPEAFAAIFAGAVALCIFVMCSIFYGKRIFKM